MKQTAKWAICFVWLVAVFLGCPKAALSGTPPPQIDAVPTDVNTALPGSPLKGVTPAVQNHRELNYIPIRELEALDQSADDLPPVIRPPQEEIREKIVREYKELEKAFAPDSDVSYDIPIVINDQVEYFIDYFQTKMRKRFSLWLARSTRYIPMMKKILTDHGLPEDLIYLAMIESGFSTKAYSRAHAVGLWQFIRETGNRYGLKTTAWVDERNDPIKSTIAAARHLSDLFNRFGSWYLAAAGYNAGEGKITRALALYNAQNFWEITANHCHYVKDETKQYVPKMIAAALIAKEPHKYGFTNIDYQPPLAFDEVTLPGAVELKSVSRAIGAEVDILVDLNPELKRWVTPPGVTDYTLRLPTGTKDKVMEHYAELTKPKPVLVYAEHQVKKGERLGAIAKRYGVSTTTIARTNRLANTSKTLKPGMVLLILQKGGANGILNGDHETDELGGNGSGKIASRTSQKERMKKDRDTLAARNQSKEETPQRIQYKVQKGDTIYSIAKKFDLEVAAIKKWNPKTSAKLLAGNTLTLYSVKSIGEKETKSEPGRLIRPHRKSKIETGNQIKLVLYTVKKGDSLIEIAQKFQTTPGQIRSWNKLSLKTTLKPGDRLSLKVKRPAQENI